MKVNCIALLITILLAVNCTEYYDYRLERKGGLLCPSPIPERKIMRAGKKMTRLVPPEEAVFEIKSGCEKLMLGSLEDDHVTVNIYISKIGSVDSVTKRGEVDDNRGGFLQLKNSIEEHWKYGRGKKGNLKLFVNKSGIITIDTTRLENTECFGGYQINNGILHSIDSGRVNYDLIP